MIIVDADGFFPVILRKTFHDTLLVSLYSIVWGNHKLIINKVFRYYLNKFQKTNLEDK